MDILQNNRQFFTVPLLESTSSLTVTHITSCLRDFSTDLLGLLLALHLPLRPAGLALPLLPDDGLVGGDVHTELLVVEIYRTVGVQAGLLAGGVAVTVPA